MWIQDRLQTSECLIGCQGQGREKSEMMPQSLVWDVLLEGSLERSKFGSEKNNECNLACCFSSSLPSIVSFKKR